ncbi:MAG: ABC transporter substrate-binding protein [Oscillospiraceae bacterium]|jgi:peptide/nickel transport system substrate-binding protein|nr:ABC transporter substrate-binding protein [Oscillospiraceae bacterium]
MKKLISILLALVMVAALAACGTKTENPPAATPTPAAPAPGESAVPGGDAPSSPDAPPAPPASGEPKRGGTLRVVTPAEGAGPIGLPWTTQATDVYLQYPLLEALFRELPNGEIQPLLAESWDVDMEKPELLIHLRKGVKFHDGSDFNAEVVKWCLDTTKSSAAGTMAAYDEITVLGEYEISIAIPSYTNATLSNFTGNMYTFISKEAYDKNGEAWSEENPVGTGPFKFVEYAKGAYLKMVRNDDYWEAGKPYVDAMEFQLIRDTMTQNIALQAEGDQSIDILGAMSGDQVKMFSDLGYSIMLTSPISLTLMPNCDDENSPLYNQDVRLALAYAIDRDAICDARGFGVWEPAYQMSGPGRGGHSLDPNFGVPHYDPAKAKELLAKAGYADGFKTTLFGQPSAADKDAVVAIQGMLAAIGITASVEFPDSGGYNEMRAGGWNGILVQRVLNMTRMETCFNLIFGSQINYVYSLPHPPELDALIVAAQEKIGDNEQELQAIQSYILDRGWVIPMWFSFDAQILKPKVRGFNQELGIIRYQDIWFE